MFEVDINGLTQQYRTKPTMNVDITGSSGSIPKPLTYDYMPEGYPSKSVETVTLMEEQEVAFINSEGSMMAASPINLEFADGDNLTVIWDGVSYNPVITMFGGQIPAFGNLGLFGIGDTTDYPFAYMNDGIGDPLWATADTAASHTIKVIATKASYEKIDSKFLPVADETAPGICSLSEILNAVGHEYHSTLNRSVTTTEGLKDVINEVNGRYSNISVRINNEFNGQILTGETGSVAGHSAANIIIADNIPDNSITAYSSVADKLEKVWELSKYGVIINSSTKGSIKKFKITVDDSGTISAAEVT